MLSVCLAIIISISSASVNAFAETKSSGSSSIETDSINNEEILFVEKVLPDFLNLEGYFGSEIWVTDSYAVYDLNNSTTIQNKNIYFVFDHDEIIGRLYVDYINGQFQANFATINSTVLNDVYNSNSNFIFGIYDKNEIVQCDNISVSLSSKKFDLINDLDLISTTNHIEKKTKIRFPDQVNSTLLYNKQLSGITWVENEEDFKGNGLCWAATIAMKQMRESGSKNWKNLWAQAVFYNLYMHVKDDTLPSGNMHWYQIAYPYFEYPNVSYLNSGLISSGISHALDNNRTIHADLFRTNKNGTEYISGHTVLITGMSIYNDHGVYTIYDCNNETSHYSYQWVSPEALGNAKKFVYTCPYDSNISYTTWDRTVY